MLLHLMIVSSNNLVSVSMAAKVVFAVVIILIPVLTVIGPQSLLE